MTVLVEKMKLERIKRGFSLDKILLKNFQKSYSVRLSALTSIFKSALFLLSASFLVSFSTKSPFTFYEQTLNPEKIGKIVDPDKRAVQWLIHFIEIANTNQETLPQKLANAKELWQNNYKHKGAIILLTKVGIDQIDGYDKTSTDKIENAIQLLESSNISSIAEKKILCLSYMMYARISKHVDNEKKGIEYGYKAIEIANSINFAVGKVFAHNQVGQLIGNTQRDMPLVLDHFLKAKEQIDSIPLAIKKTINPFISLNIASAWSELGNVEKAIEARLNIIKEVGNTSNPELIISTVNNLGADYFKLKKYELAEEYLGKTVALMNEHNSLKLYKGIPMMRLGLIKIEQKKIKEAATYRDSIEHWLKKYSFPNIHKITYFHFRSNLAEAENNLEQAVYWLEMATAKRDSLRNIIGPNKIIKLEEQSKFNEIQRKKIDLEELRDQSKSIIQSQKLLLYTTIVVLILIGIIFRFFLYKKEDPSAQGVDKNSNKENIPKSKKQPTKKVIDQVLMKKIGVALREEKLYLSQDLTLKKFADHLNSNTSYLSKTINDGFKKNFSVLINDYRIEEVLRLFEEEEHQIFTIESIYKKAGFKSKSSFQKSFKMKTSQTASLYLSNLKEKKSRLSKS